MADWSLKDTVCFRVALPSLAISAEHVCCAFSMLYSRTDCSISSDAFDSGWGAPAAFVLRMQVDASKLSFVAICLPEVGKADVAQQRSDGLCGLQPCCHVLQGCGLLWGLQTGVSWPGVFTADRAVSVLRVCCSCVGTGRVRKSEEEFRKAVSSGSRSLCKGWLTVQAVISHRPCRHCPFQGAVCAHLPAATPGALIGRTAMHQVG